MAKPKRTAARRLRLIGWREWLSLPELDVESIKAKIDSGARTSSIHAFNIRPFSDAGEPHVAFSLHPLQRRRTPAVACVARVWDQRRIRSSNGQQEMRYVIRTTVRLGEISWPIELSLTDRDEMGFRMLLGRQAIRRRFLIDTQSSYAEGRMIVEVPKHKPLLENAT